MRYFNDTTTKNGVIQKCEEKLFGGNYGVISGNDVLLKSFTNRINTGLDKARRVIYKADSRFQDDDPNYTTVPIDTTDMTDNVSTYTLDKSHVIIEGVEVKDINGKFYPLNPIDYRDVRDSGSTLTEYETPKGLPSQYDISSGMLRILPAPDATKVTLTAGLKIIYKREPKQHTYTDTLVEIGLPRMYQHLPELYACQEYSKDNSLTEKAREFDKEIEMEEQELKDMISKRNKDELLVITTESIDSR